MKRNVHSTLFYLLLACFFSFQTFAQQAPDFTETDIDGNEQHLYSYLDAGKAVIIDFSATWCGPCWTVHQTHVLEDLYQKFGPEGADILQVMYIECDPATTLEDLQGTGTSTQGNWLEGSSYPFIDLETTDVPTSYGVTGYPSIFHIGPDGTNYGNLYGSTAITVDNLLSRVLQSIDPVPGVKLGAYDAVFQNPACGSSNVNVNFLNTGDTDAETINVTVMINGMEVSNSDQAISVASLESENIDIPIEGVPIGITSEIEVIVSSGGDPISFVGTVDSAPETDNYISVKITGDANAELDNSRWSVVGSDGTVHGSGQIGNDEEIDVKVYVDEIGCYDFIIEDPSFGDGISGGEVLISNSNGDVIFDMANFGVKAVTPFHASSVSNVETEIIVDTKIYPNPNNGAFQVDLLNEMSFPVQLNMVNTLGQSVYNTTLTSNVSNVETDLSKGSYIINLIDTNGKTSAANIVIE